MESMGLTYIKCRHCNDIFTEKNCDKDPIDVWKLHIRDHRQKEKDGV